MFRELKTLAVRLEPEQRARLDILARLGDTTVTELIREAIEVRLAALAADPTMQAKADALRAEIEQAALDQKGAIAQLFDVASTPKDASSAAQPGTRTTTRRKATS